MRNPIALLVASLVAVALAACSGSETRLELALDTRVALDSVQIKVNDRLAIAEPLDTLSVIVPDDMAGNEVTVEVWGLAAGHQVAFGAATATPILHDNVRVAIVLAAVSCGVPCEEDAVICATGEQGGTLACVQDADGCLVWSDVTPCPGDRPFCSNGTCAATCTDECSAGDSTCDSSVTTRTCGQYDNDACLDWSPAFACGTGQTCAAGRCGTPQICDDNAACDDGNPCTVDDFCLANTCGGDPIICDDPPAPACLDTKTLRTYSAVGTCGDGTCSYQATDLECPTGCADDRCRPSVDAGMQTTCVVKPGGEVVCWGRNTAGQIDVPPGKYVAVSIGFEHGCGIRTNGTVVCWGGGAAGNVTPPSGVFRKISAGGQLTCGLRYDKTLACWGEPTAETITNMPSGFFLDISSGTIDHACAVKADNTVTCWGDPAYGVPLSGGPATRVTTASQGFLAIETDGDIQFGGNPTPGFAPQAGAHRPLDVDAGLDNACARGMSNEIFCWGKPYNTSPAPSGTFRGLSTGAAHSCGVRTNDSVTCWGFDQFGETFVPPL